LVRYDVVVIANYELVLPQLAAIIETPILFWFTGSNFLGCVNPSDYDFFTTMSSEDYLIERGFIKIPIDLSSRKTADKWLGVKRYQYGGIVDVLVMPEHEFGIFKLTNEWMYKLYQQSDLVAVLDKRARVSLFNIIYGLYERKGEMKCQHGDQIRTTTS